MNRLRAVTAAAATLLALTLTLAACGGGDDDERPAATSPAPRETPGGRAAPPGPGALPPQLFECLADKGYEVESPAEIHSAPPEVVQACFQALHQGDG